MKFLSLSLCAGLALPLFSSADPDGIYADFSTSMGDFTASLNYTAAPQAVANFIGLAEGTRAWVDEATGALKIGKPYYNGLTFHRIVTGSWTQSGSPNGQGTDGPGYTFRDETSSGLFHDAPHKLSMANAGPNTNGSQFFFTASSQPDLDGRYTIFGEVVSGASVVDAINATPNSGFPEGVPLITRTLNSVTIRRVGAAAQAFDIHAQGLPICHGLAGELAVQRNVSTTWQMTSPQPVGSIFQVFRSGDLSSWSNLKEIYRAPDSAGVFGVNLDNASLPRAFYHLPCVSYPGALGPSLLGGKTIEARFANETQTLTFDFNPAGSGGSGSYVVGGDNIPFSFTLFSAQTAPYTATWIFNTTLLGGLRLRCGLDSETASHITGHHYLDQFSNLSGWQLVAIGTLTVSK